MHDACPACRSRDVKVIERWQYMFMMSVLPVVVTTAVGIVFTPLFLLFIPAILLTNDLIARRKTPFMMCRSCRRTMSAAQKNIR
ncbi:hypothetical protein [Alkalicoccus luteus]|uniref:Uncharacterized protein n=1 Tax=Alkalicoccus luteus TaxID=1237094 RepID=A0A969PUF2_9BACI|nr:hypothetical protein [Alkalicoccus luteus]NJP38596.1 hypothetical protein [Alkalicoccus luteus]